MSKKKRYKKIEKKILAELEGFELAKITFEESTGDKDKVRYTPPIKIKLKP